MSKAPERASSEASEASSLSPLPGGLREAYAWTEAAGEIGELSRLKGRALNKYAKESAANSREHGELVYEEDIRELAKWLSETAR